MSLSFGVSNPSNGGGGVSWKWVRESYQTQVPDFHAALVDMGYQAAPVGRSQWLQLNEWEEDIFVGHEPCKFTPVDINVSDASIVLLEASVTPVSDVEDSVAAGPSMRYLPYFLDAQGNEINRDHIDWAAQDGHTIEIHIPTGTVTLRLIAVFCNVTIYEDYVDLHKPLMASFQVHAKQVKSLGRSSGGAPIDTDEFVTEDELSQTLNHYATSTELSNAVSQIPDTSEFLTDDDLPDTSEFLTDDDLPDTSEFLTRQDLPQLAVTHKYREPTEYIIEPGSSDMAEVAAYYDVPEGASVFTVSRRAQAPVDSEIRMQWYIKDRFGGEGEYQRSAGPLFYITPTCELASRVLPGVHYRQVWLATVVIPPGTERVGFFMEKERVSRASDEIEVAFA